MNPIQHRPVSSLDTPITRNAQTCLTKFRVVLSIFIIGLVLSGLTAFPLEREIGVLVSVLGLDGTTVQTTSGLGHWILTVRSAILASETGGRVT